MRDTKIAVIGVGAVGVTTAYALLMQNIGAEILLVDIHHDHTEGELLDLQDAMAFSDVSRIRLVDMEAVKQASIVVIAAGVAQKPGQTRLELLAANRDIMQHIAKAIQPLAPETIVVVASNPVDIMTYYLQHYLDLPKSQVIGSGTLLDSQRFRGFIADKLDLSASSVHAYILGEHGDSQFPAWHSAHIAGALIDQFAEMTAVVKQDIAETTKRKAYEIINRKGATYYGIAACLAQICRCIIHNKRYVLPLSSYIEELEVCLSLPVVLGRRGIERRMAIELSKTEQQQLIASAAKLKSTIED